MSLFYTDGDYVSDEAEYDRGTNPQDGDTDRNGKIDYSSDIENPRISDEGI